MPLAAPSTIPIRADTSTETRASTRVKDSTQTSGSPADEHETPCRMIPSRLANRPITLESFVACGGEPNSWIVLPSLENTRPQKRPECSSTSPSALGMINTATRSFAANPPTNDGSTGFVRSLHRVMPFRTRFPPGGRPYDSFQCPHTAEHLNAPSEIRAMSPAYLDLKRRALIRARSSSEQDSAGALSSTIVAICSLAMSSERRSRWSLV